MPDPEAELLELESLPETEMLPGADARPEPDLLPDSGAAEAATAVAVCEKLFCVECEKDLIAVTMVRLISIRSNTYSVVPWPSFSFQNLFQMLFIQPFPFLLVSMQVHHIEGSITRTGEVRSIDNGRYHTYCYQQLSTKLWLAFPTTFAPTFQ